MPPLPAALRFILQAQADLLRHLPAVLVEQRWFGGKARRIRGVRLLDAVPLTKHPRAYLLLLQVRYTSGPPEQYLLPLCCVSALRQDSAVPSKVPHPVVASLTVGDREMICFDGIHDREAQEQLLALVTRSRQVRGLSGTIVGKRGRALSRVLSEHSEADLLRDGRVIGKEQSNTALLYGNALFFKIFRKLEEGIQPDIEVVRFLSEKTPYRHIPQFAGSIEYRRGGHRPVAIAVVQEFVPNRGDGWGYALRLVTRYFDRVCSLPVRRETRPPAPSSPLDVAQTGRLPLPRQLIGRDALKMATLLGTRTGELHLALASDRRDPAFAPAPCSEAYQRVLVREQFARAAATFRLLRNSLRQLPAAVKKEAEATLCLRHDYLARIRRIGAGRLAAVRIRCHGDYHLGQILYTGNDFIIIDFEGEPAKPLRARREKHPPFRDAAGMMRSFHYAAYAGLFGRGKNGRSTLALRSWADAWYVTMAGVFLRAYLNALSGSPLLPSDPAVTALLLETFLVEKALYEVAYELNNRPSWLPIPLTGIRQMIGQPTVASARPARPRVAKSPSAR